ncbi:MAG: NPCBM/NEW2 domain-containing protein [Bacillota bacterium]
MRFRQIAFWALIAFAPVALTMRVSAVEPMTQAREWVVDNFAQPPRSVKTPATSETELKPGLLVLANHDPVQLNARAGKPLRLGDRQYQRGLYCHANSKVIVRLPGQAKTLDAIIGVDHNSDTSGGRGSVTFSVEAGGKRLYQSPVLHGGQEGIPVHLDLSGAKEFTLYVDDAGDGIACDQSDWAEARVTLADGKELWLGELPFVVAEPRKRLASLPPFTFVYGGQASDALLGNWRFDRIAVAGAPGDLLRRQTLTYTDEKTGLQVRCKLVKYDDFPAVEWTLYFKNTGTQDTPILEDIRSLDTRLALNRREDFVLHHFVGSPCTDHDYEPLQTSFGVNTHKHISTTGGRPTNSDLPYFNLETGQGGVIAAVGWPGQWAADFVRETDSTLRIAAGQEGVRLTLHPGEEIRSPLNVLLFYDGDWLRGQNLWRRWMMAHNMPHPGGKIPAPELAACSSHQYGEMINANEENQKMFIDGYLQKGFKLDYWWMDAGWYINEHGWPHTGTWEVDTKRFPNGLRAISDYARGKGVKTIVWFEPERVAADTWLSNTHPEWIHGGRNGGLLKLGEPVVREWTTNHVDQLITSQGVDLYRQDFNIDPLPFWQTNDSPDRQGMTEIRHVEGYLAYWDELLRRHPNMLIDSCASGGRRNDLETLRRAVPLLRSDFLLEPISQQNHAYGIAFWIPFYGTGLNQFDAYSFRSMLCPHITACYDMRRKDQDYERVLRMYHQWREQIAPNYAGDYWPLTPYSKASNVWCAWQFDRPEAVQGVIQAFRRPDNPDPSIRLRLRGVDPNAQYEVRDLDRDQPRQFSGRELLEQGLTITASEKPAAVILTYRKLP